MREGDKKYFEGLDKVSEKDYKTFYDLLKRIEETPVYDHLEDYAYTPEGGPVDWPSPDGFVRLREQLRKERVKNIAKEQKQKEREKAKKEQKKAEKIHRLVDAGLSQSDAEIAVNKLR